MIYYRCDLCGKEQELSKVQQTVHDPCARGVKLPESVVTRVEGIKDICMLCYETIMAESNKVYAQAKIDAEQAMFNATIKLLRRTSTKALPKQPKMGKAGCW